MRLPVKVQYSPMGGFNCLSDSYVIVDADTKPFITLDFRDIYQMYGQPLGMPSWKLNSLIEEMANIMANALNERLRLPDIPKQK